MAIAGYVWFDAEFSSLELEQAALLQVAAVATDAHLKPLTDDLGPLEMAIQLDPGVEVSPWVKEHLSGLITRCGEVSAVSLEEADARLSDWLQTHFGSCSKPIHERPLLAGNSVHNDWLMVRRHLPKFHGGLHYRLLDVSSFKTVWEAWGEVLLLIKSSSMNSIAIFQGEGSMLWLHMTHCLIFRHQLLSWLIIGKNSDLIRSKRAV